MAYIGKEPIVGNFQVCDAISVVNGQAAYTMQVSSTNVVPESVNHMLVSLNGILQKPGSSFTISGSTITFASALSTGDVIDFIMLLGNVLDIGTPSDSTVTDAKANFVSTSSGAGLQIKGDGTTDGTLQLNCSQNSHGIKLKSPAHSAGQSYTLTFPTTAPSSGKALITDGSGNLSFSSAGSFTKLATTTISSAVSAVNFDNTVVGGYNYYQVRMSNIGVSNDADDIGIKLSGDNGSSFGSIEATRAYPQALQDSGNYDVNSAGDFSYHLLTQDSEATESPDGISGAIVDIFNASNTSNHKHMISHSFTRNQNGGYYTYWTVSRNQLTDAVNYIRINNENNTLDSGTFTLYGIES